jgi:hypothetical protein
MRMASSPRHHGADMPRRSCCPARASKTIPLSRSSVSSAKAVCAEPFATSRPLTLSATLWRCAGQASERAEHTRNEQTARSNAALIRSRANR